MVKQKAFFLFLLSFPVVAQDLTEADWILGLTRHQQLVASSRFVSKGEIYNKLKRVFENIAKVPAFQCGPVFQRQFFFLDDSEVNAFATGGGRIYATDGLMQAIQGSEGILAFVLGHEMAHNHYQHGARKYLRAMGHHRQTLIYTARCREGDKSACLANIGSQAASAITERRLERDEEHEADLLGLKAAAEAGYHPD